MRSRNPERHPTPGVGVTVFVTARVGVDVHEGEHEEEGEAELDGEEVPVLRVLGEGEAPQLHPQPT